MQGETFTSMLRPEILMIDSPAQARRTNMFRISVSTLPFYSTRHLQYLFPLHPYQTTH
jgi:hypothetical protein